MINRSRGAVSTTAHNALLAVMLLSAPVFAVVTAGNAEAVETGDFKAPQLDGFRMTAEEEADGDGDGLKETHVKHYGNAAGDRLFSLTTKGKLWAWSLQSHAGAGSNSNYVIRDSNCDGEFDQRYSLDDEFHVPDCLSYRRKP